MCITQDSKGVWKKGKIGTLLFFKDFCYNLFNLIFRNFSVCLIHIATISMSGISQVFNTREVCIYACMHTHIHTYTHASLILHQVYMTKKPQTIIKYSKLGFILLSVILETCNCTLRRAPQQWSVCCHKRVIAQLMEVQEPWTIAVLEMGADSSPSPGVGAEKSA